MLQVGLDFAPGTTDDCKRLVAKFFSDPKVLLGAYRNACAEFDTSDIVLLFSDQDPTIRGARRMEYCAHLKNVFGTRASGFKMWGTSAHSMMKLPQDSEAMWLVVDVRGMDLPIMCVIYAVPYATEAMN